MFWTKEYGENPNFGHNLGHLGPNSVPPIFYFFFKKYNIRKD